MTVTPFPTVGRGGARSIRWQLRAARINASNQQKDETAEANLRLTTTDLGQPQKEGVRFGKSTTSKVGRGPLRPSCAALAIALSILSTPAMADPQWLNRAMEDVGRNPTGWSHQWCANWLHQVMPNGSGNLAANWSSYGKPSPPRVGAIAIMSHHVGIVAEIRANSVVLVSGNHSGKAGRRVVGLGIYRMSRIISFRWPE